MGTRFPYKPNFHFSYRGIRNFCPHLSPKREKVRGSFTQAGGKDKDKKYRIAKQHNIPFEIKEKHFNDLDEVLEWVDFNQLGRRNLIDEQRAIIQGRLYKRRKRTLGREYTKIGDKLPPILGSHATAKLIARKIGVNEKTVRYKFPEKGPSVQNAHSEKIHCERRNGTCGKIYHKFRHSSDS